MTPIDIILPIYGGLDELRRCLDSLLAHPQRSAWNLVLINDASPFPEIHAFLDAFAAAHPKVEYRVNAGNLGFVGTVNRGMRLHPDRDLVLLNSDTEVHGDWLDRMLAAARQNPDAATLTPFSNNATICSFPRYCEGNPLPRRFTLAEVDVAFRAANPGETLEIPTGVGFCMFIRRAALNAVGLFDEERFGRGYGEENDFCRRAAARGMPNLLLCDTFVYHAGGVSFADEADARASQAQETLDRLHPDYHGLVHRHIAEDPQARYRLAAWIELLRRSPRPRILQLSHYLGGGTRKHVEELIDHLEDQADFLLLIPKEGGRVELDLSGRSRAMLLNFRLPEGLEELVELLQAIGVSRVHFHHTLGLETSLWGLPKRLDAPFDITLHDYYFINANPTQTTPDGHFSEEFEAQAKPYPLPIPVEEWQQNQHLLLYGAERVIAPSAFAAVLYRKHFPQAAYRVAYHPEWEQWSPYPDVIPSRLEESEALRVLVFGAISIEKGANLLEQAAKLARDERRPLEFHLIGYAYRPLDAVIEHGSYDHARVVEQVRELRPHLIWFTALWPETYSYTLSEALAAAAPIVAPNIGAFPERLVGRPLTWIEPWNQPVASWIERFEAIRRAFISAPAAEPLGWGGQEIPRDGDHFYRHRYLEGIAAVSPPSPALTTERLQQLLERSRISDQEQHQIGRRERLLVRLVRLRQGRLGRLITRLIPVRLQKMIKRRLSHRPIHELL